MLLVEGPRLQIVMIGAAVIGAAVVGGIIWAKMQDGASNIQTPAP